MKTIGNLRPLSWVVSLFLLLSAALVFSASRGEVKTGGEENAVLTFAPNVPPAISRDYAKKVIVELETVERIGRLADGVEYAFWTFGGEVPGKFIRVREGDQVEFHLKNSPESKMPHNIDLHSVAGPGGGASSSLTAPGNSSIFSFTALNPGLYVYHCATAPVGMHISNGMYGLIYVEPKEGLPPVDHEYYVFQSEFYTGGSYGEGGLQPFDMAEALRETPDYVVFNGSVGALTEANAMTANVGETIRLFVGNGGPNLISSFHVIGEQFDVVYQEGGTIATQQNVQTTLIPPGGSAIVEFKVDVPGVYHVVDHSIFRAFNKGALGTLVVHGDPQPEIYTGLQDAAVYLPEGGGIQEIIIIEEEGPPPVLNYAEKMEVGRRLYAQNCAACHQPEGQGITGAFPPLAGSDYLFQDPEAAIAIVLYGLSVPIQVNSVAYDGVMPAVHLSDTDVASILTFVMNSFGNDLGEISIEKVLEVRSQQ